MKYLYLLLFALLMSCGAGPSKEDITNREIVNRLSETTRKEILETINVEEIDDSKDLYQFNKHFTPTVYKYHDRELHLIRYDGCEYLLFSGDNGYLAHKGNCDNPQHLYNTDGKVQSLQDIQHLLTPNVIMMLEKLIKEQNIELPPKGKGVDTTITK